MSRAQIERTERSLIALTSDDSARIGHGGVSSHWVAVGRDSVTALRGDSAGKSDSSSSGLHC